MHARVDRIHNSILIQTQTRLLRPLRLNRLQFRAHLPLLLRRHHQIIQRLQIRVRRPQDKSMISTIDRRSNQRRRLTIRSRDSQQIHAHDIRLRADRDEPVDVLADRHEDFAGHVPAFLGAGGLVLDVDAGGALFDEELGEFHDGCETAVAGVGVGDEGTHVIDIRNIGSLLFRRSQAFFALFAVVEELRHEEMLDFVWDSVHGVVGEIGRRLVGTARSG